VVVISVVTDPSSGSGAEVVADVAVVEPSEFVVVELIVDEPSEFVVVFVSVLLNEPSSLVVVDMEVVVVEPSGLLTVVVVVVVTEPSSPTSVDVSVPLIYVNAMSFVAVCPEYVADTVIPPDAVMVMAPVWSMDAYSPPDVMDHTGSTTTPLYLATTLPLVPSISDGPSMVNRLSYEIVIVRESLYMTPSYVYSQKMVMVSFVTPGFMSTLPFGLMVAYCEPEVNDHSADTTLPSNSATQ
jgi:hypothetical protein